MPKTAKKSITRPTRFAKQMRRIEEHRRTKIAKSQTQPIDNVTALVRAFGGADALAELLKIAPCDSMCVSQVADWMITGDIPTGYHFRLYWHLTSLGYVVDPYALVWTGEEMTPKAKRPGVSRGRASKKDSMPTHARPKSMRSRRSIRPSATA